MRKSLTVLWALVAAVAMGSASALADTHLTTPPHTTNQFGQPVKASVSLKVKVDRIFVRLTNDTSDISDFDQTISAISFRLPTKMKAAHMGSSSATPRVITENGFQDSKPDDTRWNVILDGDLVTLKAPGQRFTILPDARKNYPKADASLLDPRHNPFLTKTVIMEVVFPDSGLIDQLTDIKIYWGHELDMGDAHLGVTDPLNSMEPGDPPLEITGGTLPPNGNQGGFPTPPTGGGGTGGGGGGGGGDDDDPPKRDPLGPPPTGGEVDPPNPTGPPDLPDDPLTPPIDPHTPPHLPEPATLGILAIGAAGLLMRRRK